MKNKKVILLLGKQESGKQQFFTQITNKKQEDSLLHQLELKCLENFMNSQICIFNIPEVVNLNDFSEPLFFALNNYLSKFYHQLIQIVYCVKYSEEINKEIEEFLITLTKFVQTYFYQAITFIISGTYSNFLQKKPIYFKNTHFVYLNDQSNEQLQNQVKSIWENIQYNQIFFKQFSNFNADDLLVQQFIAQQKTMILDELKKNENILMFFDSLNNLKIQIKKFENKENQQESQKQIYLFCELILLQAEYHYFFFYKSDINNKWSHANPYKNCILCNKCVMLYSFNNLTEYQLISPFKILKTNSIKNYEKSRKCYKCNDYLTNSFNDYFKFLIQAIINHSVTQYYELWNMNSIKKSKSSEGQQQYSNSQVRLENQQIQGIMSQYDFKQKNQPENAPLWEKNKKQVTEDLQYQQQYQQQNMSIEVQISSKVISEQFKISSLFISCENHEKSFIFTKLNHSEKQQRLMDTSFQKSSLIRGKYQFFDSPCFSYLEEFQSTIAQFKEFLSRHEIHFIFLFLDYQRLDLMKKQNNYMLQKLYQVDRQKMALVITNWQKHTEINEEKIIQEVVSQKKIKNVIFTNINDSSELIQLKFLQCLEFQTISPLSFANTLFAEQTDEAGENIVESNLKQLEKKIEDTYEKEQKEKLEELKRSQEYLLQQKQYYLLKIKEIDNLNVNLNEKISDVEKSLCQLRGAKIIQESKLSSSIQLRKTYLKAQD